MKQLATVLLLGLLAWETSAGGGESALAKVRKSGEVIVGLSLETPPFSFREKGEVVGFDVELARAVVKKLEKYAGVPLKMRIQQVTDETRISWVQSGQVNLSVCNLNNTRKRDALIDFTVPYFWDGKGLLYQLKDGTRDLKDFAGKTIGFKRASSSEGEIQTYFKAKGWEPPVLKQFDNHVAGIQAVVDGLIAAYTDDNSIIINTAMLAGYKVGPTWMLGVTATPYSPAYFGMGVPEDDSKWRDALNYCLHDLWNSGEYHVLYNKWFGPGSNCPIPLGNNHMEPFVGG